MATLEEAAVAFTERFVADVAAGGARMAWQRWPQKDYGDANEQVIAFWMWPAAFPEAVPPTDDDEEEEQEEGGEARGFWFELRHETSDAPPYPDGYADFTLFIAGGKWIRKFGVDLLVEMHADDSPAR